jgi:hypothetical protein
VRFKRHKKKPDDDPAFVLWRPAISAAPRQSELHAFLETVTPTANHSVWYRRNTLLPTSAVDAGLDTRMGVTQAIPPFARPMKRN